MKIRFKCIQCGACCKDISGKLTSSRGLPLFEWEVKKIKKLAKKHNLPIEIKPIDNILDKLSGLYFCTGYLIKNEPCTFLKNNKCLIYKNRPIICRAFPIAKNPLFLRNAPNLSCFSECPNFNFNHFIFKSLNLKEGKPYIITNKKITKEYNNTFDKETFGNSFIKENIFLYFNNIISTLSKNKLIDIKISKENKKIPPIPFFEFLVKRKFIKNKDKIKIINKLLRPNYN